MKLGLLGGTFNPPHNGHLAIANEVRTALGLDRVLLIPAPTPPHKPVAGAVSFAHRLAMTEAAVSGVPGLEASDIEGQRGGQSYTVHTLEELQRQYPSAELYMVIGMDSYLDLPTWYQWQRLFDLAHVVTLYRPGYEADRQLLAPVAKVPALCYDSKANEVPCRSGKSAIFLAETRLDLSSSEIRAKVAEDQSIDGLVPAPVAAYIKRHQLYRTT